MSKGLSKPRRSGDARRRKVRLAVEPIENRVLPSVLMVTSTADSGTGTLRDTIAAAANGDTIEFNLPGNSFQTINVLSPLVVDKSITIQGPGTENTDPGGDNASPTVGISGAVANIFDVTAPNVTISGLVIGGASNAGILIESPSTNTGGDVVKGCFIGAIATSGPSPGANQVGIVINGVSSNTIGGTAPADRNVISGNVVDGIDILSGSNNLVKGNFIGTDVSGTSALANQGSGVLISSGGTTIGGTAAAARNVISGNAFGVTVSGAAGASNLVQGNFIGTDVTGTDAVGNRGGGVVITGQGSTTVGGTTQGAGNLVSGNGNTGVAIINPSTQVPNVVQGNFIGTNASGTAALRNLGSGIYLSNDSAHDIIGGSAPGAGNTISGNNGNGISGSKVDGAVITGNKIGTDPTGSFAIANAGAGILVAGSSGNSIGGASANARNIISGNGIDGIAFAFSVGNEIIGNYIGVDASGTKAIPNRLNGVVLRTGSDSTTIGGNSAAAGNVISGNGLDGVFIDATASGPTGLTSSVQVMSNFIGTDASGTAAIPNGQNGIQIAGASTNNQIGGAMASAPNVISGNAANGILMISGTSTNLVQGNLIGTARDGVSKLPNAGNGVEIIGGASNRIGGTAPGASNTIANSGIDGVLIIGRGATDNFVLGNAILGNGLDGVGLTGQADFSLVAYDTIRANLRDGVRIDGQAQKNSIGVAGINVISGNSANGIEIAGGQTAFNILAGNFIGTDDTGKFALGNGGNGVAIDDGAGFNFIGLVAQSAPATTNVISANHGDGILIADPNTTDNVALSDYIGTDATTTTPMPNGQNGVEITGGANLNRIGLNFEGALNVISGNAQSGIAINGPTADVNVVQGTHIGTNAQGSASVGNQQNGIVITNASGQFIGGSGPVEGNLVSGNHLVGIEVRSLSPTGATAAGNTIQGNKVGTDVTGTRALTGSDTVAGILIDQAINNIVGGAGGAANLVSGNAGAGVEVSGDSTAANPAVGNAGGNAILGNRIGTDSSGSTPLGNALDGIFVTNAPNTSIGTAPGSGNAGNLISANRRNGIHLSGRATTNTTITANLIGTNAQGRSVRGLGNAGFGILVDRFVRNTAIARNNVFGDNRLGRTRIVR